MPSYAFAIGNVRMYLRIGPKTRTTRRFSKTRPDARTKAKKRTCPGKPGRMVTVTLHMCKSLTFTNRSKSHAMPVRSVVSSHRLARQCRGAQGPKTVKGATHTRPFNGPLSGTTRVSRYQKCKTNLDFTEARDSEWQWHQLGYM